MLYVTPSASGQQHRKGGVAAVAPEYQGTAFAYMSVVPVCSTVAFVALLAACAATAV